MGIVDTGKRINVNNAKIKEIMNINVCLPRFIIVLLEEVSERSLGANIVENIVLYFCSDTDETGVFGYIRAINASSNLSSLCKSSEGHKCSRNYKNEFFHG